MDLDWEAQSRSGESCGSTSRNCGVTDEITNYDDVVLLCKAHIISHFKIMKQHNTGLEQRQKQGASQRVRGSSKGNQGKLPKKKECQLTPNLSGLSGPGLEWWVWKSPINWFLFAAGEIDGPDNLPS